MTYPSSFFINQLAAFGPAPCLKEEGGASLSYADMLVQAKAAVAPLGEARQLVFIEGSNSRASLLAYIGCLLAGHVVHLTDPLRPEETRQLARKFGASAIAHCEGAEVSFERLEGPAPALHPDLALLLSTSGSTGTSKLVKISWQNLDANTRAIVAYLGLTATDRTLTTLKPHYSFGLSVLNTHLCCGGLIVLSDISVQDDGFVPLLQAEGITGFSGVPYTFQLLDAKGSDLSAVRSLRAITQAGGKLAPALVRKFGNMGRAQGWKFIVMYGQTEASPRMAYLPPEHVVEHPDCIGIAIPGGRLALRLPDGTITEDAGQEGELIYSGPNVMMGYAYAATDLASAGQIEWLHTGDVAQRTPEGLFRITGRTARFVKPYGVRISLDELEQHLAAQGLPCLVVGSDQEIVACYEGQSAGESIPALLSRQCSLPHTLFSVHKLAARPLLGNGKTDYRALEQLVLGQKRQLPPLQLASTFIWRTVREGFSILLGTGQSWQSVADVFQVSFPARRITPEDSFVSLDGDSLVYVQISLGLEEYLGALPKDWHRLSIRELEAAHG